MEVYLFEEFEEEIVEFIMLKFMFDVYLKNGDIEKFYFKYYVVIFLNFIEYFKGLLRNVVILLLIKVVDCMIVYCKNFKVIYNNSLY